MLQAARCDNSIYDGAEVCKLVEMFALSQLPKRYERCDIGLYRDTGLAVFKGMLLSMAERAKKDIIKSFNDISLRITFQTKVKTVYFLEVKRNLCNGKF